MLGPRSRLDLNEQTSRRVRDRATDGEDSEVGCGDVD